VVVGDGDGSGKSERDTSIVSFGVVSCGAVFFAIRGEENARSANESAKAEAADLGVGEVLDAMRNFAFRGCGCGKTVRHPCLTSPPEAGLPQARSLLRPGTRGRLACLVCGVTDLGAVSIVGLPPSP